MSDNPLESTATITDIPDSVTTIIGFDLGDGETALTKVARFNAHGEAQNFTPEPIKINGRRSNVTALGKDKDGHFVIGDRVILGKQNTGLYLHFKKEPCRSTSQESELLVEFVRQVHQHLEEDGQIGELGTYFYFVGCPSGWNSNTRGEYEALLRRSGVKNLSVVPESHAALIFNKETQSHTGVTLIVDIGSSTTDFTFSEDVKCPSKSDGVPLGGSLIDMAIFNEFFIKMLQNPEHQDEIELYHKTPRNFNETVLKCRRTKQDFFTGGGYETPEFKITFQNNEGEPTSVWFSLTEEIMRKVLATPVKGSLNWKEAFRQALEDFKAQHIVPAAVPPGMIILTGGGSGLSFVRGVCQEVFPGWRLNPDNNPDLAIASGLAHWGRVIAQAQSFKNEARAFIEKQVPDVVGKKLPDLFDLIVPTLSESIMQHVVKKGLENWRGEKVCRLNDLEAHMKDLALMWGVSSNTKALIKAQSGAWLKEVEKEISREAEALCVTQPLFRGIFQLQGEKYEVEFSAPVVDLEDPTLISGVVHGVVASILIVICIALHAIPLVGLLVLAAGAAGAEEINNVIKAAELPSWVRKAVLNDGRIEKHGRDARIKIEEQLREQLSGEESVKQLTERVTQILAQKMDERLALALLKVR